MFLKKADSRALFFSTALLASIALAPTDVLAADITLTGTFAQDNTVQLFDVVVASGGLVDFRSYGYGGGTTSTGQAVAPGGFDTILTLFSGADVLLTDNDEGDGARIDTATGQAYDARITLNLTPGSYILALTQYDNFAIGPNLADGFAETGHPRFTADSTFTSGPPCPGNLFRDTSGTSGQCRSAAYAVDFRNVESAAARLVPAVPEPATGWLMGGALALSVLILRRKAL